MPRNSFRILTFLLAIGLVLITFFPVQSGAQDIGSQQAPPPPVNIKAFALRKGVRVDWDNVNATVVSEFIIYRLENYSPDTTLKLLATVPHDAKTPKHVSYMDYTAQYGRTYTYFLTTKTGFGVQSSNSQMVTVTTPTATAAGIMGR